MKVKWKGKLYPEAEMSARDGRFVERTIGEPMETWTRLTQVMGSVFASVRAVDPDAIAWDELEDMPVAAVLECLVEERKVPLDRQKKAASPPRKRPATRRAAGSGSTTASPSTGAT